MNKQLWSDERIAFAITDAREDLIRRGLTPGIVDSYQIVQRIRDEYEQRIEELRAENACLHALRSDLLAACEALLQMVEAGDFYNDKVAYQAERAIAKAKGEANDE